MIVISLSVEVPSATSWFCCSNIQRGKESFYLSFYYIYFIALD